MASDARGLRDLTLWETNDGGAVNFHMVRQARPCRGVPAVAGITVAEVEELQEGWEQGFADGKGERDALRRERDEARAERDNVSVEAHHWMGQAARYREALEAARAALGLPAPHVALAERIIREALERITAAHVAGASAGELADRARAALHQIEAAIHIGKGLALHEVQELRRAVSDE